MTQTIHNCQFEIDVNRGVAYVHYKGMTILRLCGLVRTHEFDPTRDQIDVRVTSYSVQRGYERASLVDTPRTATAQPPSNTKA
jgi:hypothetical protein